MDNLNSIKRTSSTLEDWISEPKVMEILNLKATSLWKLKSTGELPYSKIGKRVFYKRQDIVQLLENNMATSPAF